MSAERKRNRVLLSWGGEGQLFHGRTPDGREMVIDGRSVAGPSPMDALLFSLAGCMGADLVHILEKSRVPLEALEVEVEGVRAPDDPKRYEELRLAYRVRGPGEEHLRRLERAVELSRDTYCSVLHTLRPDLDVEITVERF